MSKFEEKVVLLFVHPCDDTKLHLGGGVVDILTREHDITHIVVANAASPARALALAEHLQTTVAGKPSAVAILPYTYAQDPIRGSDLRTQLELLGFQVVLLGAVPPIESNRYSDGTFDTCDIEGIASAIVRLVPVARELH